MKDINKIYVPNSAYKLLLSDISKPKVPNSWNNDLQSKMSKLDISKYSYKTQHVVVPVGAFVILLKLFCYCRLKCCRKRGVVAENDDGPSVTVTSTTQHIQSPQVVPPYPIDPRHPTPATNTPGPGFGIHQAPYPTHQPNMPFPQGGVPVYPPAVQTPYPPAPYPTASHDYSANPPPYDIAVSQPPMQPLPTKDGYVKQAPYNPGYN